jgi:hypothetical protein
MGDVSTAESSWVHRRWVPPVAGAVAFLLTLVAGLGFAADWALRTSEMRSLISEIYESESVMEAFQEAAFDAVEEHRTAGPQDRGKLDDELIALAIVANEELQIVGDEIAALPILPCHRAISEARDAYLVHNVAWQDYTARVIEDPAELLRDQPLVNSTFEEAQQPLLDAIPQPDLLELELDVWVIYMPPESQSGEVVSALARVVG